MLNWTEDGQLDEKQNQNESRIPYRAYLQKNVRVFRLLFVLAFMLTDAGLTIKNVTINSFMGSKPPKFRESPNIFFNQTLFTFFSTPQNQF